LNCLSGQGGEGGSGARAPSGGVRSWNSRSNGTLSARFPKRSTSLSFGAGEGGAEGVAKKARRLHEATQALESLVAREGAPPSRLSGLRSWVRRLFGRGLRILGRRTMNLDAMWMLSGGCMAGEPSPAGRSAVVRLLALSRSFGTGWTMTVVAAERAAAAVRGRFRAGCSTSPSGLGRRQAKEWPTIDALRAPVHEAIDLSGLVVEGVGFVE
jgi:hypothetical protein